MKNEPLYQNIKIEKIPASRVKIFGEIAIEAFEKARLSALERVKSITEVPGFRVGKAPEALVVRQVGGMKILEQAAEAVINDAYGKIIDEHDIRAIGEPYVSITKIAPGNPLGFTIETAVMPEISFKNYLEIARKAKAKIPDSAPAGDEKNQKKPAEKKYPVEELRRAAIVDELIASAKPEVPDIMVESELDMMIGQFRADIERNGLTFNDYLTSVKKKTEDIRKEWRESAARRAQLELILKHIAREEKISPDEIDVNKEVERILANHKTADRFSVRMYVENVMKNKMVLEFLEERGSTIQE